LGQESGDLYVELERLLAEGVESALQREAATFDELAGPNTSELVLFGVGETDSTSSLRSPVGTVQEHYLCRNQ